MHRALRNTGIEAELHVIEAGPHGGFFGARLKMQRSPEKLRRFLDEH